MVHLHAHLATAAAEVALDTFLGIKTEMEKAEAIEQRQQPAQRTENAAPGAVDEEGRGEEGNEDSRLAPAHKPAFAREQAFKRIRNTGFQSAGGAKPADRDDLLLERDAFETQNQRQEHYQAHEHRIARVASPTRQRHLPGRDSAEQILEEPKRAGPTADD